MQSEKPGRLPACVLPFASNNTHLGCVQTINCEFVLPRFCWYSVVILWPIVIQWFHRSFQEHMSTTLQVSRQGESSVYSCPQMDLAEVAASVKNETVFEPSAKL